MSITTSYTKGGYVATFTGKVSSDGSTMSGRWSSNAHQSGTWTATLTNTDTATCKAGKACSTTLKTSVSSAVVTAGPGAAGKLTETVDPGSALHCAGYTAHDPHWYGAFETARDRAKSIVYKLLNTGRGVSKIQVCFGAPYSFKTKSGRNAQKRTLAHHVTEFDGLLPACTTGGKRSVHGPCISSRRSVPDSKAPKRFDAVITVKIPAGLRGDPRLRV